MAQITNSVILKAWLFFIVAPFVEVVRTLRERLRLDEYNILGPRSVHFLLHIIVDFFVSAISKCQILAPTDHLAVSQ